MSHPTVSVALATYNGERYLREQLDSIAGQSRPPDELLIGDDQSTDGTSKIVEEFAASAPFAVRFERNAERLGSSQNFATLLARSQGDVILLSDQDDVWSQGRVQRSLETLAAHPNAAFTFSNARLMDEHGEPLSGSLWDRAFFGAREQQMFAGGSASTVLLRTNVVTGATMALRRAFLPAALPIPKGWVHDGWLAFMLAVTHGGIPVNEPWIAYRVHAAQQIGVIGLSPKALLAMVERQDAHFYRQEAENFRTLADRLTDSGQYAEAANAARAKAAFLERRALGRESLGSFVRGLGQSLLERSYVHHGLGLKQIAFDAAGACSAAVMRAGATRN